jgi:hypothetical protein
MFRSVVWDTQRLMLLQINCGQCEVVRLKLGTDYILKKSEKEQLLVLYKFNFWKLLQWPIAHNGAISDDKKMEGQREESELK